MRFRDSKGILNLRKTGGKTSRDVVDQVLRIMPGKRKDKPKVGHAGTLDPLATGVLVICVGAATRLIENVQSMPKTYHATIRLGATSSTLDADGSIVEFETPCPIPGRNEVERALQTQIGSIHQMPPQYSALRVDGRRAYEAARAGIEVDLAPRVVRIDAIRLIRCEWPWLDIEVDCGSGTYIRSIARDVGELLGCGGLIQTLSRTRIGGFRLEDAIDADALTLETLERSLMPLTAAIPELPRRVLDEEQIAAICRGQAIRFDDAAMESESGEVALVGPQGDLIAIAQYDSRFKRFKPRRVFADSL